VTTVQTFEGTIMVNDGGGAWVEVPGDVITALGGGGRIPVHATFDGLSFSHRREDVNAIIEAKKPQTRVRRIAKAAEMVKTKSA
jgi:uncharacterized protein YdeI (YjbR/CyaY-like superfamily)